jgi:Tfp pilus assembly protein PilF
MNWIIPTVFIGLSAVVIVIILIRKIPSIRVINVDSIPKERARKIKEQIILQRFQRSGSEKLRVVAKASSILGKEVSRAGRKAVQRLYALEQYYQRLKRTASEGQHAYDQETIHRLTKQAEELLQKDEQIPAEKIFIDIISHNPKSVDAYEGLGDLYLANGQFDQARETLLFALRLSPNDASVNVSLAELEMKLGNTKAAVQYLKKAIQKRSKNPKYLDLYIEAALKAGSLKDAQEGIKLLKEVNPENQKIPEFEERFLKQKQTYVTKTTAAEKDTSQDA